MRLDLKKKAVLERIRSLEQAIAKAKEYVETGKHANWEGFRPLFVSKFREGKELPPHRHWVKNMFLPHNERALWRAEKILERLDGGKVVRGPGKHVEREGQGDWEE